MNDFKLYIMMVILSTTSLVVSAQRKVESGAYNLMLKALLKEDVPEFSAKEAHKLQENYQFIDSREKEEFDVSHIKDAIWVGYDDYDVKRLKGIKKNQPIIVYCSVGARSEKITRKLIAEGYTDVLNLYGGIFEWINNDFSVVNSQGKKTSRIHGYSRAWAIWLNKGEKVY